jgi:alpha-amylase
MCTKFWNDGDVHKYFSPFDSPYDAYMYFMNVYSDLESSVKDLRKKLKKPIKLKDTWILGEESTSTQHIDRVGLN